MSSGCACQTQDQSNPEQLTPELLARVDEIMEPHRGQPNSLIQVLHQAQNAVGYLPRVVQVRVAEGLNVPLTKVYGVVSFYSLFTTKPKGRHKIHVCAGTACFVRGANQLLNKLEEKLNIKPGDTTGDGNFSVDVVRCLGACGLGPVVTVDGDVHGRVTKRKLDEILTKYA